MQERGVSSVTAKKLLTIDESSLPEGWTGSTLADVTGYIQRGKGPKYIERSDLPVINQKCIRWFGIQKEHLKYVDPEQWSSWGEERYVRKGDVLWNSTGTGTIGRAALVMNLAPGEKYVVDSHVTIVRPRDIDPQYVHYWIMSPSVQGSIEAMQSGSTNQVELSKSAVEALPIPVAPPDQQKSIVAEIEKQFSRLDEAVANLKRVKVNLKRYKASVLKAAVEGELAPTAEPWKQVVLGDVTTSIRNGYSKKPDAEHGTRIFRISAVRPMKLDANDVRYLSGTPAAYEPFLVEPGDVLFTRYNGNRDYVGVCARVPANLPPTVYPDKLIRVRVPRLMMLPEFLVILASTGRAREYIESKIRTTAGQSGISGGDLKVLPLDIPRVEEQLQIVAEVERRLSVIEELEAAVQANLTRADRLRQSILSTAFSGRLAVSESVIARRANNFIAH